MTQTLKQGDRGALVSLLQLGLERAGQTPGALDGIFGAQTAAAVRAFQAASALTPDGIAGARTHRALLPYYTGFVTPPSARATHFPPSRGSTARAWTPSGSPIPTSTRSGCRSAGR